MRLWFGIATVGWLAFGLSACVVPTSSGGRSAGGSGASDAGPSWDIDGEDRRGRQSGEPAVEWVVELGGRSLRCVPSVTVLSDSAAVSLVAHAFVGPEPVRFESGSRVANRDGVEIPVSIHESGRSVQLSTVLGDDRWHPLELRHREAGACTVWMRHESGAAAAERELLEASRGQTGTAPTDRSNVLGSFVGDVPLAEAEDVCSAVEGFFGQHGRAFGLSPGMEARCVRETRLDEMTSVVQVGVHIEGLPLLGSGWAVQLSHAPDRSTLRLRAVNGAVTPARRVVGTALVEDRRLIEAAAGYAPAVDPAEVTIARRVAMVGVEHGRLETPTIHLGAQMDRDDGLSLLISNDGPTVLGELTHRAGATVRGYWATQYTIMGGGINSQRAMTTQVGSVAPVPGGPVTVFLPAPGTVANPPPAGMETPPAEERAFARRITDRLLEVTNTFNAAFQRDGTCPYMGLTGNRGPHLQARTDPDPVVIMPWNDTLASFRPPRVRAREMPQWNNFVDWKFGAMIVGRGAPSTRYYPPRIGEPGFDLIAHEYVHLLQHCLDPINTGFTDRVVIEATADLGSMAAQIETGRSWSLLGDEGHVLGPAPYNTLRNFADPGAPGVADGNPGGHFSHVRQGPPSMSTRGSRRTLRAVNEYAVSTILTHGVYLAITTHGFEGQLLSELLRRYLEGGFAGQLSLYSLRNSLLGFLMTMAEDGTTTRTNACAFAKGMRDVGLDGATARGNLRCTMEECPVCECPGDQTRDPMTGECVGEAPLCSPESLLGPTCTNAYGEEICLDAVSDTSEGCGEEDGVQLVRSCTCIQHILPSQPPVWPYCAVSCRMPGDG